MNKVSALNEFGVWMGIVSVFAFALLLFYLLLAIFLFFMLKREPAKQTEIRYLSFLSGDVGVYMWGRNSFTLTQ
jgi:hypothetical protein